MDNTKTTTLIVDDEISATHLMKKLLEPFPLFGNISIITNPTIAFNEIIEQQPLFLFLDIEMPGLSGLQISERIKQLAPHTKVIFVTAYDRYALDALRQNAFDYLLKPVDRAELVRVVEKLLHTQLNSTRNNHCINLLVRSKDGIYHVPEDDIIYFEADCSYTTLVMKNQPDLLWSCNLGKIIPLLTNNKFIRISRKHMVNRSYIHFYHAKQKYLLLKTPEKEFQLKVMIKVHDLKELLTV